MGSREVTRFRHGCRDAVVSARELRLLGGAVGEVGSRQRAALSGLTRGGGLHAALVIVVCLVFAPSAAAFSEVPGSPFPAGEDPVSVAFSPDGGLLATANDGERGAAGTVSVFSVDQASGALTPVSGSPFATDATGPTFGTQPAARSVAFSPGGRLLAIANEDSDYEGHGYGSVSVFAVNSTTGALTPVSGSPFAAGEARYSSVAFSPGGGLLAAATDNLNTGEVSVFSVNPTTGALTPVSGSPFATGFDPVSVAFSPRGGLLATGSNGFPTSVSVFSVAQTSGALTAVSGSPFAAGDGPFYSVAFSPGGGLLATAGEAPAGGPGLSVFSVDQASGALTQVPGSPFGTTDDLPAPPYSAVAFSPGGGQLAEVSAVDATCNCLGVYSVDQASGALTLVSALSEAEVLSDPGIGFDSDSLAFSPGGGLLAAANGGGSVSVFSTSSTPAPITVVGSQAIAFTSHAPTTAVVAGPSYAVAATGGASGNPVTFSSATSGVCAVSGSTVSFVGAGICTLDANQAGNSDYTPAPTATQSFVVAARAAATGNIAPDGSTITVQRNHEALIKVTCTGTATCSGRVTITVKRTIGKGKKRHTKTQTIGTATFSIPAGTSETVRLTLNGAGRALLSAAHGHLSSTLTILKASPSPSKTQTHGVDLVMAKSRK
jgi:6-phosphogluconolactonase